MSIIRLYLPFALHQWISFYNICIFFKLYKHISLLPLVSFGSIVSSFFISSIDIADTLEVLGANAATANLKRVWIHSIYNSLNVYIYVWFTRQYKMIYIGKKQIYVLIIMKSYISLQHFFRLFQNHIFKTYKNTRLKTIEYHKASNAFYRF